MPEDVSQMPQPVSLGKHSIPHARIDLIRAHIAMLSATALAVSETVPFQADVSDFIRTLEAAADED